MPRADQERSSSAAEAEAGEREALAGAIVSLLAETSLEALEVEDLCARAGVPTRRFHHHFESIEDLCLRTFEAHAERFERRVFGAFADQRGWRPALRAAGYEAARFIDEEPEVVRFGVNAMLAAGERAQLLREAQQQRLIELLDAGRWGAAPGDGRSRAKAEASFGAIYQTLVGELTRGGGRSAVSFVPELMYVAVRPFLGHDAALEELRIPVPDAVRAARAGSR
jgi:AcrR family transcriptional regulator